MHFFRLQTPDEPVHLSAIIGCGGGGVGGGGGGGGGGVRSCDRHWEKRTNVSGRVCLSVQR